MTPLLSYIKCNNRNNADYYAYGLPVQDSNVSDQDPYLYGGKEFYSVKGINIYDFSARTYAPDIARFMQPDPNAGDYHWLSPYTFCGGDPINRIDPDGREIHVFQNDSTMNEFAANYPDNEAVNIVAHGNQTEVVNRETGERESINTAEKLVSLINKNYQMVSGDVQSLESVVIQLFACFTGQDRNENTKSIAQKFSDGIPNAIIIAPDCKLGLNSDGTVEAKDVNPENPFDVPWRVFHRGSEIKMSDIPIVKRKLANERFLNTQLSRLLLKTNLKTIPKTLN